MSGDELVPDLEVARYALRSFRWSVESVEPTFKVWLDGLPPPILVAPEKPGDPAYPPRDHSPGKSLGVRRWREELASPPGLEHLGLWSDDKLRVWRAPTYVHATDWVDGTCEAVCRSSYLRSAAVYMRLSANVQSQEGLRHSAPHEGCSCGIYGSLSYADLVDQFRHNTKDIIAVIAAEGTTIIGDRGLRTAFARVVAYWVGGGWAPDNLSTESIQREVAAAQFIGAKPFETPLDMVEAYGLRLLPPSGGDSKGSVDWTKRG